VDGLWGRGDDPRRAAHGVDLLLVTTTDDAIRRVAAAVEPVPSTVVAHCSGAHPLDVLEPHARRASLHPLASLPDAAIGTERLTGGCAFAVDGDPLVEEVVASLGGRSFRVRPEERVRYHAAAVIASNHLVALLGQVQRVAAEAGLPLDAYFGLVGQTLDNVRRLGPEAALTGPVARGDWATVYRHLIAIGPAERHAYEALAQQAARLAGRDEPSVGAFSPMSVVPAPRATDAVNSINAINSINATDTDDADDDWREDGRDPRTAGEATGARNRRREAVA
jgi:predicted short-subunit dehydrogenase-like oxidoreductase (DUF2520 family)